ncbi:MAG TPA: hypothetical protein VE377_02955 [Candidatus Dormibacteraeota bacterium]|nr:hypothetical protein [Candidatus Dormibacteraeota bacterium]
MIEIHPGKYKTATILLLTAAAMLIHGYHPYAEDAEIYLPGVERMLNSVLFPVGQEFFQSHASMTLFPNLVAWSLRVTHLPLETGLLVWQVASIFLLLVACWQLSGILFDSSKARWGSVCLIAGLLTTPVAGTALYIMDQYLNPRNLAAFAAVFAVTKILERKYVGALVWIVFAAIVHPLMWVFPFSFGALWILLEQIERRFGAARELGTATLGCVLLLGIPLTQSSPAYHETARMHSYFYIQYWAWYEWLGIFAPLAMLWWFARMARAQHRTLLARACRAFAIYGVIYFCVAVVVDLPPRFESLARIQPMRSLHLLYMFLFVCLGGFLGEYVLKGRVWRWLALFVPLSIGMFAAQRALFPASAHAEWPGRAPKNPWAQAFVWIRTNTPTDAIFAMDPDTMRLPGEDAIGFRCIAQRSRMADTVKDGGAVSMFPPLGEEWWAQVQAQTPWKNFQASDFRRLGDKYGVSWVVVQQPGVAGLACAYQNAVVRVCRVQ